MGSKDQRVYRRVTVNREFESIDDFVSEYVTDISKGGVFIRSKNPLVVGTEVNLKFSILTDDFEMIEGLGRVVRVTEDGMGVLFTELTPESQRIVESLTTDAPNDDVAEDGSPLGAPAEAEAEDEDDESDEEAS